MVDVGLHELVAALGGELTGDATSAAAVRIDRIGSFEGATASTITFVSNPRLQPLLATSVAGCVIVGPALRDAAAERGAAIVCADPYLAYAKLTQWWAAQTRHSNAAAHKRCQSPVQRTLLAMIRIPATGPAGWRGRHSNANLRGRMSPRASPTHMRLGHSRHSHALARALWLYTGAPQPVMRKMNSLALPASSTRALSTA